MHAPRVALLLALAAAGCSATARLPEGYLDPAGADSVLDKTLRVRLQADLSALSAPERAAVDKLIEAGPIFEKLYELQRHQEALTAQAELVRLHEAGDAPAHSQALLDLYRMFQGPIMTTLANERVAFLPVAPERPGKTVYPIDADPAALDAYVAEHPEALQVRSVLRGASAETFASDLATLDRHPVLSELHPDLRADLEQIREDGVDAFYVIPYSLAYADDLVHASDLLGQAAETVAPADADFADFLRKRARDLLDDDYEAGDAAWITGRFKNLNAQIGSYETYADALHGVKSFFGMSLLLRDREKSDELASVTRGIQRIEDGLPYAPHKRVHDGIPIGVYTVIADWGQPRGTNTATILPNESHIGRKYGRTILLRASIMTHPGLFDLARANFRVAVHPDHAEDLDLDGDFHRTVWHEIGHYLGPEETRTGEEIDAALLDTSDLLEEMKADLIALFSGRALREMGYYDDASLRSLYASGVRRVLLKNRPRREQAYGTMQLMQLNFFLENGVLEFDESQRLRIHYDQFHASVARLLEQVLELQAAGDKAAADAFIERYTAWEDGGHALLAQRMKDAESYRFRLVTYGALGE